MGGALPKPVAVAKRSRQSVAERDPSIPSASSAEGSTATPSTVDVSGAPPFASFCACMASARQTPVRDFHLLTRACPLLMAGMGIATDSAGAGQHVTEPEPLHSGASAATPAGAPAVTAADVKERLDEMFSGDTGAPVNSSKDGIIDELRQVHVPIIVGEVEALQSRRPELFDKDALVRPCGTLDTYEAAGMVVGDLHGLPLIPARPHGLAIGKKLQKLQAAIAGDLKKAAKRKDSEKAKAEVLSKPVKVELPTREECIAYARAASQKRKRAREQPAPEQPAPEPSLSLAASRWLKDHGFASPADVSKSEARCAAHLVAALSSTKYETPSRAVAAGAWLGRRSGSPTRGSREATSSVNVSPPRSLGVTR